MYLCQQPAARRVYTFLKPKEIKKRGHHIMATLYHLSGKRGSNSRPEAWEASTLPTELLPQFAPALRKVVQR